MELPATPSSAAAGRRFVRDTLRVWKADSIVEAAELAVSELVSNAVLHARSAPLVRLRLSQNRLRLEVSDASSLAPASKPYGSHAATGRGMMLVRTLATNWGTTTDGAGKTVWCEFEVPDVADTPGAVDQVGGMNDVIEIRQVDGPV